VVLFLCLDCSIKYERLIDDRLATGERHINYLEDLMADTVGFRAAVRNTRRVHNGFICRV
jgi:hypothetical protein